MEGKNKQKKSSIEKNEKQNKVKSFNFLDKKSMVLYLSLFFIIAISAIYLIFFKSKVKVYSTKYQMTEVVRKVRKLEDNIKDNQSEILNLVGKYKNRTGKNIPVSDILNLDEKEADLLKEKIKLEKDVSIKNLLKEIIGKKSEIINLKKKIRFLEKLLPEPYLVKPGDNHYKIAMDYLLNKKNVNKKDAIRLVERTLLFDSLVPGFKVWNFYSNGEFGTFITQGKSPISPNAVARREKKKILDERDRAIDDKLKLEEDFDLLLTKRNEIISQIRSLEQEKKDLSNRVGYLTKKVNSLFYISGLKKDLKKRGYLKGGFLRKLKMQSIPSEKFSKRIDLRERNEIEISAEDLNISRIRKITIYPKLYKPGSDFDMKMENKRKRAVLRFKNLKKFLNEKILISVE